MEGKPLAGFMFYKGHSCCWGKGRREGREAVNCSGQVREDQGLNWGDSG